MKSAKLPGVFAFSALVLGLAISASASTITFTTATGSTVDGNLPIDAQVTLTTSTNLITLTLSNLQTKISDIDQTLSGVSFDLDDQKTSTTLSSSSGLERTINSNRTFTDGASVSTGWQILLDGTSMQVMLPNNVDTHTIIGPASGTKYTNADSTIAGNANNNPFLTGPVTFVIPVAGVTSATQVDWATFHFGLCARTCKPATRSFPSPAP